MQLWQLLQDTGAKSISVLLHHLFLYYSGITWAFQKNVSLLLLGETDSADSAAGCVVRQAWRGNGFIAAFSLCPLASALWSLTKLLTHEKKSPGIFLFIFIFQLFGFFLLNEARSINGIFSRIHGKAVVAQQFP